VITTKDSNLNIKNVKIILLYFIFIFSLKVYLDIGIYPIPSSNLSRHLVGRRKRKKFDKDAKSKY